jgi:hypothetical protein
VPPPNGSEASASEAIVAAPTSAASNERVDPFPPPSWKTPVEPVALFPPPAKPAVSPTVAPEPAAPAPADGLVCNAPNWSAPIEPFVELLPPPLLVGAPTFTDAPAAFAESDGLVLTPFAWTTPVELPAVFPPPTCAAPVEFVAVLLPEPPIDVGAETAAPVVDDPAPTDGFTDVPPA